MLRPQRNVPVGVRHEDVDAVCNQSAQPSLYRRQSERERVGRQDEGLGVSELSAVCTFVFYDGAPQIDLTVDSVPVVSRTAEVVERFGGVDPAGAIRLRGVM